MDMNAFRLDGKVALVTGASYGIGFAIASAMGQMGARIVFNDRNPELIEKGVAAYKELGIEAAAISATSPTRPPFRSSSARLRGTWAWWTSW